MYISAWLITHNSAVQFASYYILISDVLGLCNSMPYQGTKVKSDRRNVSENKFGISYLVHY